MLNPGYCSLQVHVLLHCQHRGARDPKSHQASHHYAADRAVCGSCDWGTLNYCKIPEYRHLRANVYSHSKIANAAVGLRDVLKRVYKCTPL